MEDFNVLLPVMAIFFSQYKKYTLEILHWFVFICSRASSTNTRLNAKIVQNKVTLEG